MLGFTNSIMFYAMAAAFVLGGYLVTNKMFGLTFQDIMLVFGAIIFGAQSVGQAASLMPDYAKAKVCISNVFALLDRVPAINNWYSEEGARPGDINGDIAFNAVEFSYPARDEFKVLKGLNLKIRQGQRIALVGSSGCGKSTVTQLIERFYDPDNGDITINDYKLKDLNLHWLRSQIGIVSQEPVLFDTTIAENIAYGDNSREVPMDEIITAAKLSNIHDFIISLPEGYSTNVGAKGTQLSGGQKQRVSIGKKAQKHYLVESGLKLCNCF
jgi:ATP-binding cassette subfamily B (MDR/TAP) protein 1